jgi:glutathione S-transferase
MPRYSAVVMLISLFVYFWLGFRVGQARHKFGVMAPATTGSPDFERAFRIQMNTLEWMPIFLPAIWLAAIYVSDVGAALVGLVWIAGRILYTHGYTQAPAKRETGFFVQAAAAALLWVSALIGAVMSVLHG